MKLYLMRHAQSEANVQQVGDVDPHNNTSLTELGRSQARASAQQLQGVPFEAIFVSRFDRAQQTARIVNEFHNVPMIVDDRLDETRTGLIGFDRVQQEELFAQQGVSGWRTRSWSLRFFDGETVAEEFERLKSFLDELKNKDYKCVLVVSHGEPLQLMTGYLSGMAKKDMLLPEYLDNAGFVVLDLK